MQKALAAPQPAQPSLRLQSCSLKTIPNQQRLKKTAQNMSNNNTKFPSRTTEIDALQCKVPLQRPSKRNAAFTSNVAV